MKLNESFVKRMMVLAGNQDYSDRFLTEAKKSKKVHGEKARKPKKEAMYEEEEEEGELLHDAEDAELEDEGDEDEMGEGSVESEDRFGDLEDDFDVEEVGEEAEETEEQERAEHEGKGESVVSVDAEKLVKDIIAALTKSLGDVVKLKDYSPLDDLDMDDEDLDMDMEGDEEFGMEDDEELGLKESVV